LLNIFLTQLEKTFFYNQYFAVYYSKIYDCFKETVYQKAQKLFNGVISSEEYQKEKEGLKEGFPSFWEKIINLFKK